MAGSPPPMRGKGDRFPALDPFRGITPAYAGKSSIVSPSSAVDWDHPRLCGEKSFVSFAFCNSSGSPPPMRGKGKFALIHANPNGITPAYAGKRLETASLIVRNQDHPRLCGEKSPIPLKTFLIAGSPPPMRGKGSSEAPFSSRARITPAYAGKRFRC